MSNPAGTDKDPERAEHLVLLPLLAPQPHGPWSVHEIGLELGDAVEAEDSRQLAGRGFSHAIHVASKNPDRQEILEPVTV